MIAEVLRVGNNTGLIQYGDYLQTCVANMSDSLASATLVNSTIK